MKTLPSAVRIVVPAYNAAATLPAVLDHLHRYSVPASVIIVDDGSTDDTSIEAQQAGVRVVRHAVNRGKGAALKTGIREALTDPDCAAVVTMDADGQHDPNDLAGFVSAWEQTGADLILGNRRIVGSSMPLHRRASNLLTSFLVSSRVHRRIPDSQCGYRLLSRRAGERAVPDSDGFESETEWLLRVAAGRMEISSVPVRTVYEGARSHMRNWMTTKAFIRVLIREYAWED